MGTVSDVLRSRWFLLFLLYGGGIEQLFHLLS